MAVEGRRYRVRSQWTSHAPCEMIVRVETIHYGQVEAVAVARVEHVSIDWDKPHVALFRLILWVLQFFTGQWRKCFAPKLKRVQIGERYNFDPMSLGQEIPEMTY